jgi:hypothetical protein
MSAFTSGALGGPFEQASVIAITKAINMFETVLVDFMILLGLAE